MYENKSIFETLFENNVNDHIEKKKDLTYLSWPYAWAKIKKKYPNATLAFLLNSVIKHLLIFSLRVLKMASAAALIYHTRLYLQAWHL